MPALAQPRGHGAVNTVGYGYISVSTVGYPVSAGHACTHACIHTDFHTRRYITPRESIGEHVNGQGLVVNTDGTVSPVVHQYDRFPQLEALAQCLLVRA